MAHARAVRAILDAAGLQSIRILASGGLDENSLQAMCQAGAPIDGFGVGTSLTTSSDAPALDCAYKLQEYAGRPRRKRSEGKATWPGRKQVYRSYHADGTIAGDVVALTSEPMNGEPLLQPAMRNGKRVADLPNLAEARLHAASCLARLPEKLRRLEACYVPVEISLGIRDLVVEMDRTSVRGPLP
jgi:nicotinate phosphoribosyltransferase